MKKRLFAIMLALAMLLAAVPALAEEGKEVEAPTVESIKKECVKCKAKVDKVNEQGLCEKCVSNLEQDNTQQKMVTSIKTLNENNTEGGTNGDSTGDNAGDSTGSSGNTGGETGNTGTNGGQNPPTSDGEGGEQPANPPSTNM